MVIFNGKKIIIIEVAVTVDITRAKENKGDPEFGYTPKYNKELILL